MLIESIASLFILLFIYTALSKWLDFQDFVGQMNNQPFDNSYTPLLVWSIPSIELIVAVMLMFNATRRIGFFAATAMMLVFTVYVGLVTFHFYERVPCSCGGVIRNFTWPQHFIFNIFFLVIGLIGMVLHNREKRRLASTS